MNNYIKWAVVMTAFLFAGVFGTGSVAHADTPRVDMVDVSNHNGQMTAPEFVYMRNTYGIKAVVTKISEGTTYHDWTAADNIRAAQEAGVYINGYHYLHATTVEGAKLEAAYAVRMAQQDGLPVGAVLVVDIEEPDQMAMGRNMQPVARAFEDEVARLGGYRSTSYTMGSHTNVTPDGEKAWIASYPYNPTSNQNWYSSEHAWQWSSKFTFASSYGVFDVNQLYDNFFTADLPAVTSGEAVWENNGVWYTDQSFKNKANGIIKHMGSYWSFRDGKLVTSDWTKAWGLHYWSGADGKIVQGEGNWHGYHFNFGTDGTFNAKSATVTDLDSIIN